MPVVAMTRFSSAPHCWGFASATSFYGGTGVDLISAANAANVSIYADYSATDTLAVDNITLGTVTSSTVYGAAGADTLQIDALNKVSTQTWVPVLLCSLVLVALHHADWWCFQRHLQLHRCCRWWCYQHFGCWW